MCDNIITISFIHIWCVNVQYAILYENCEYHNKARNKDSNISKLIKSLLRYKYLKTKHKNSLDT